MKQNLYPRSKDRETIYLKQVIRNPNIEIGDYTIYNDFVQDPKDFEKTMFYINTRSIKTN